MAGVAYSVTKSDKFCFPQGTSTKYIHTKPKKKKSRKQNKNKLRF